MALSGRANGTVQYNSAAYTFYVDWTAQQSVEGNYSMVTTYLRISNSNPAKYKFQTQQNRPVYIDINGNRYDWSRTYSCDPWPGNPFTIDTRTVQIPHNPDGTKSFYIEAGLEINIIYNGDQVGLGKCICNAQYFTLDSIPRTPSAPPNLKVAMNRDHTVFLSWDTASGYVTDYELEYLSSDPNDNAYSEWKYLDDTGSTSYTYNVSDFPSGTGLTYHVRAKNGGLVSGWTDTGWVFRKGGLYVPYEGAQRFGCVYAGTSPQRAKGVFVGNAQGKPEESIRISNEKEYPLI